PRRGADGVPSQPAGAEPPGLSPLLLLSVRGADRKLDAERGAGLARPAAHELPVQARAPGDASVLTGPALLDRERCRGGSSAEASPARRDPDDARAPGPAARPAGGYRSRGVLARGHVGSGARLRQRRGPAGAPVVRDGAG